MPDLLDLTWPKRTERLELRPALEADVHALWLIRRLPEVGRYMTDLSTDPVEFAERMRDQERMASTLVIEHRGSVVGDLMLRRLDLWAQSEVKQQAIGTGAEIGWCLHPELSGQGLATEAGAELVRIAFEELGVLRVRAECFAENEPSWRLMERLGMRREGHHRQDSLHRDLGWVDGYTYALLAHEWAGAPKEANQ